MPNPQIEITIKPPGKMKLSVYKIAMEKLLRDEGTAIEKQYRRVSDGFSSAVVYRKDGPRKTVRGLSITVSTTDKRMVYLDRGTKERWAVMSNPFVPKTRKHYLGHGPGQGRAVIRGRRAMQARGIPPRPGIKAREFSKEIVRVEKKYFQTRAKTAMAIASKKTF